MVKSRIRGLVFSSDSWITFSLASLLTAERAGFVRSMGPSSSVGSPENGDKGNTGISTDSNFNGGQFKNGHVRWYCAKMDPKSNGLVKANPVPEDVMDSRGGVTSCLCACCCSLLTQGDDSTDGDEDKEEEDEKRSVLGLDASKGRCFSLSWLEQFSFLELCCMRQWILNQFDLRP